MMGLLAWIKKRHGIYTPAIELPRDEVAAVLEAHGTPAWFLYAFERRAERWHVCDPSLWVARNVSRQAVIVETGCGCALNLIWLGQRGFSRLYGVDIDGSAIAAGKALARLASLEMQLREGECKKGTDMPGRIDLLLALNWTYHDVAFDLETFLLAYRDLVPPGGHLVIDVIDSSYNDTPGNVYLTSDRHLPEELRRPSEYRVRYCARDVAKAMKVAGFKIVETFYRRQAVPVVVYVARRKSNR